ncbi:MAG: hypothetical protein PHT51_02125 [Patescibacteria group bacterium]|nr:hypothetical protein [Patescibacteria group bacterium]MDD4611026.1 hypothetical protein [Patescibacteria group bacterium]
MRILIQKYKKYFFPLLAAIILLLLIFLFCKFGVQVKEKFSKNYIDYKTANIERNYQNNLSDIINEYLVYRENNTLNIENIEKLKNELLGLKVPGDLKDLHLAIFLSLNKIEDAITRGDEKEKNFNIEKINEQMSKYPWLKK